VIAAGFSAKRRPSNDRTNLDKRLQLSRSYRNTFVA
jgi:hypothetical protein